MWHTRGVPQLPYEYAIGLRYTRSGRRSGRRNRFISFISGLSAAGIMLGVAALIIVLSVMNGFQKEVRDRMLSVLSHVEVFGANAPLTDWPRVVQEAKRNQRVLAGAPYVACWCAASTRPSSRAWRNSPRRWHRAPSAR